MRLCIILSFLTLLCSSHLNVLGDKSSIEEDEFKVDEKETEVEDEDDQPLLYVPKEKINFTAPKVPDNVYYVMYFTSPNDLQKELVLSQAKKDGVDDTLSKYDGQWSVEVPTSSSILGDYALVLKSKAHHHAVSAKLKRPFKFDTKQLVLQYEVKFQEGMECGGSYVKLLTDLPDLDLKLFNDKSSYTIMFGPDKCGMDYKLHFIFRHKHPKTGTIEEKHAKKPKGDLEKYFTDKKTHLYTLVLNDDNTFEILIDQVVVNSGSLLEDMTPSVNPPKEIDDPNDKKPEDWDERAKIPDPNAVKPDDWDESEPEMIVDESAVKPEGWLDDEPLMISDPSAVKPKDWDEEMDGEWEAPKIDNPKCKDSPGCGEWKPAKIKNPKYKGKWSAPLIDNPAYKGIWKPRRIPNPDYFEDSHPYKMMPFSAIGLELWSMTDSIVFDNFIITDNKKDADDFAAQTFTLKKDMEMRLDPSSQSVVDSLKAITTEKPWIWAVVLVVGVLPLIILIVYCCTRSSSDKTAHQKKTDSPSEDVDEGDEADEEDEVDAGSNVGVDGDNFTTKRKGKDSLEDDDEEEEESNKKESEQSSEDDKATQDEKPARKRRTRKD